MRSLVKMSVIASSFMGMFFVGSSAFAAYTGNAGSATGTGPWNICNLIATPTLGTTPLTVTLTGGTYSSISPGLVEAYSNIDRGDGTYSGSVTGLWTSPSHARFTATHTYTTVGVFPINDYVIYAIDPSYSWIDKNASATCSFKSITTTDIQRQGTGKGNGPFCGNGIVETPEQCDDGSNNGMPGYGCSTSCTLIIPSCDVTVTPSIGWAPLSVALTITGAGGRIYSIDRMDSPVAYGPWMGTPVPGTPYTSFVTGHTYSLVGTYGIIVTMFNPDSPNLMRKCSTNVTTLLWDPEGTGFIYTGSVNTGSTTTGVKASTGAAMTGVILFTGVKANTGAAASGGVNPTPVSFGNITPAVVKNVSRWAYQHGVTALPLSDTQMASNISRYAIADMFVRFAKNVMKQTIIHKTLCDITHYSDYDTFTSDMRVTVTNICDLGLMGLTKGETSLIGTFDVTGLITSDQLRIIINRYQPGMLLPGVELTTRNIDFLLDLFLISSKK